MNEDKAIFWTAYHAAPYGAALDRACAGMSALGAYHADVLRIERIQIRKRHARQLLRTYGQAFDFVWFQQESHRNARLVRLVDRWRRRFENGMES